MRLSLLLRVGLIALCAVSVGCAATAPRRTTTMETFGVDATTRELQVLIHEVLTRTTGLIEVAATDIYTSSADPGIRHRAAAWPTHAVPEFQWAMLREDPLTGVVNGWIFAVQMSDFFATGVGRDYFGPHQQTAIQACAGVEAEFERLVKTIRDPKRFDAARTAIHRYAANHPISNPLFARASPGSLVVVQVTGSVGGLRAASEMNDQMRELTDRIGLYTRTLPRQVTWQTTLMLDDAFRRFRVERDSIIAIARIETDRLMEEAFENVGEEREEILAAIAREREILIETIATEREAVFAAVTAERIAAIDQIEAMTDSTVIRASSDVQLVTKQALDHAFMRGLQLGGLALVGILLLVVVAWMFIRRDLVRMSN